MKIVDVVLLGGARRVTLAEQIKSIVQSAGANVRFFSVERDAGFYPISDIAEVVAGPRFTSDEFLPFLRTMLEGLELPLPIACMDAALLTLSYLRGECFGRAQIVAPMTAGAKVAFNKALTAEFCIAQGILQPRYFEVAEEVDCKVIAKPVEGFGGKGIHIIDRFTSEHSGLFKTHIVQEFVGGRETTHDLYIGSDSRFTVMSRDRLAVIDGEVDHCIVRQPRPDEVSLCQNIANSGLFWGPVTVQTMANDDATFLIEINARLGGGVTASIAAGFGVIEQYLLDSVGLQAPLRPVYSLEMKRARRDFYRVLDQA